MAWCLNENLLTLESMLRYGSITNTLFVHRKNCHLKPNANWGNFSDFTEVWKKYFECERVNVKKLCGTKNTEKLPLATTSLWSRNELNSVRSDQQLKKTKQKCLINYISELVLLSFPFYCNWQTRRASLISSITLFLFFIASMMPFCAVKNHHFFLISFSSNHM